MKYYFEVYFINFYQNLVKFREISRKREIFKKFREKKVKKGEYCRKMLKSKLRKCPRFSKF